MRLYLFKMDDLEDMDLSSYDNSAYDDDSLCTAYTGESEPICNNWRGWKSNVASMSAINCLYDKHLKESNKKKNGTKVITLFECAAKIVAHLIPIEIVERCIQPVPEDVQLRLAYWSFPGK